MKLKRLPEDFQVEELTEFTMTGGPFAVYRLEKRSIGTPEAIDAIARSWHVPRHRLSYGGLKDKHALTMQYVTLKDGPRRSLQLNQFELVYIGQAARPFEPKDIAANRFHIVIRDLSAHACEQAQQALIEVQQSGLPNYFDDQRFGSVGESGEFIARPWCAGDYERALWLALADAHPDDRADEREQKRILREHWGRWPECKAALQRSNRRSIITYLADKPAGHPGAFRGAFALLRVDMRSLYLAAFQSYLWNRLLATVLRRECPSEQLFDVPLQLGPVPFFRTLPADVQQHLANTLLPLPSARLHLEEGPQLSLIQDVLAEVGLELRELRVKYPRDSFFSKGERAAVIAVRDVQSQTMPDDLYPKRHKMTLQFVLPRGSYATILVKRLTTSSATAVVAPDDAGS